MTFDKFCLLFISLLFSNLVLGQSADLTSVKQNDPEAKRILDKIKSDFNGYNSLEINFDLQIEVPDQPKEISKGSYIQDGLKFVAHIDQQDLYCDGSIMWLYLKQQEEIQVSDYDEEAIAEMLGPKQILKMYDDKEYIFAIIGEDNINNKIYNVIEFKPVNRSSEYAKLRMLVSKSKNKLYKMTVFSKDGSKISITLRDLFSNKKYPSKTFTLDTKLFPDAYVEDLRF